MVLFTMYAVALAGRPSFAPVLEDYGLPGTRMCFPSGLRVVVQSDAAFPVVSVTAVVDGGLARGSVAHLEEHLWFRSRPDGGPEVDERLEALGASWNAHTAYDHRAYSMTAPPSALADLGRLAADLLLRPLTGVDAAVLDTEREIVRRESELRGRPLWDVATAELARRLFPAGHPYATLGGSPVPAEDLAAVGKWSTAWDGPRNATVYVVGHFPLEKGVQTFMDAFPDAALVDPARPDAPLTAGECAKRTAAAPPLPAVAPLPKTLDHAPAPVDAPVLAVAWSLPGAWRDTDGLAEVAVELFEEVLGHYVRDLPTIARRLDDGGVFEPVACHVVPGRDASIAECFVEVDPKRRPEQVLHLVRTAADDLTAKSIVAVPALAEYLTDVYRQARIDQHRILEDVGDADGGRALAAAVHLHQTGSATFLRDWMTAQDAVTPEALSKFYRSHFTPDRLVAVVLDPAPASPVAAATAAAPPAAATGPAPAADELTLASLVAAPSIRPSIDLGNGLDLLVLPLGTAPRVHVALFLRGGPWRAPDGVAELQFDATRWFYATQTTSAYERPREFLGEWSIRHAPGGVVVELAALSGNLPAAVWSVRDLLDHLELDRTLQDDAVLAWQGWLRERPERIEARALVEEGAWPAAAPLVAADAGALSGVSWDAIADWHTRLVGPGDALLVVAGRVDPATALAAAKEHFGTWKAGGALPAVAAAPSPAARRVTVLADDTVPTAEVVLGCVAPGTGPAVAEVAGAAIERTLWTSVRESTALAYDPDLAVTIGPGATPAVWFEATVAPADAARVVAAWDRALAGLGSLGATDLAVARRAAAVGLRTSWTSVDGAIARVGDAFLAGRAPTDVASLPAELAHVDAALLAAFAKACAGHEQIAIVGPSSASATLSAIR